jgi:hypothetical protein
MKLKFILLAWIITVASSVWAEGKPVIPHSSNADGGYVSTQLLLKPCMSEKALKEMTEDLAVLKDGVAARKAFPPGTCDDRTLVEKIFKARFLQYATLNVVTAPWRFDETIAAQDAVIGGCRNTRCLNRELNAVIAALSPIYLHAHPEWPRGKGLCTIDPVDTPTAKVMALLGRKARKAIAGECGSATVTTQTCDGSHGGMLFVSCAMEGNQVNAPEWIYRMNNGHSKLLFNVDDGPLGVMESTCNGMPDLMTSARVNMGEQSVTYYRYDGKQYQSFYSYTAMSVGTDDNGNGLRIAQGGRDAGVTCR